MVLLFQGAVPALRVNEGHHCVRHAKSYLMIVLLCWLAQNPRRNEFGVADESGLRSISDPKIISPRILGQPPYDGHQAVPLTMGDQNMVHMYANEVMGLI